MKLLVDSQIQIFPVISRVCLRYSGYGSGLGFYPLVSFPACPGPFYHHLLRLVGRTALAKTPYDQVGSPTLQCIWLCREALAVALHTGHAPVTYPLGGLRFFSTWVKMHSVL